MGRPAFAIVMDSPASTRATSRDKCVFASWMFTIVMELVLSTNRATGPGNAQTSPSSTMR